MKTLERFWGWVSSPKKSALKSVLALAILWGSWVLLALVAQLFGLDVIAYGLVRGVTEWIEDEPLREIWSVLGYIAAIVTVGVFTYGIANNLGDWLKSTLREVLRDELNRDRVLRRNDIEDLIGKSEEGRVSASER